LTTLVDSSGNPITFPIPVGRPDDVFYKLLVDASVSPSVTDMKVNALATSPDAERQFEFVIPATTPEGRTIAYAVIVEVHFNILDSVMTPSKFGAITALANGCTFKMIDGNASPETVLKDLLDGTTISTIADFSIITGAEGPIHNETGAGHTAPDWHLSDSGKAIALKPGELLRFGVNDDLTGLIAPFNCMVHGFFC